MKKVENYKIIRGQAYTAFLNKITLIKNLSLFPRKWTRQKTKRTDKKKKIFDPNIPRGSKKDQRIKHHCDLETRARAENHHLKLENVVK